MERVVRRARVGEEALVAGEAGEGQHGGLGGLGRVRGGVGAGEEGADLALEELDHALRLSSS